MNGIIIDTKRQSIWLCQFYLQRYGILGDTFTKWLNRGYRYIYEDELPFINYDSIPEQSRVKLPSKEEIIAEYKQSQRSRVETYFFSELEEAYQGRGFAKWVDRIKSEYKDLTLEKATEYARKASVFEKLLELHQYNCAKGTLELLHEAFDRLYPNNYKHKTRFCTAINKARSEGVLSVAVDKRSIVKRQAAYGAEHKYLAEFILGHNKGFNVTSAYEKFSEACIDQNYSIQRLKKLRLEKLQNLLTRLAHLHSTVTK